MGIKASELFSVQGKTALVTGATSGIGEMIARGLVEAGATVFICSRKSAAVEATAADLAARGECIPLTCDVTAPEQRAALAQAVRDHGGGLNILVNNAGRTWGAPFEEFPSDAWEKVNRLNLEAPFALTQTLLPEIKKPATDEHPSCIINIGSIMGLVPAVLGAYSYAASKAALHHLTRILATELAAHHITVNAIAPGCFPSRMWEFAKDDEAFWQAMLDSTPLKRVGTPEDIVGLILTMASRAGSFMTGNVIPLDGGANLLARW